MMSIVNGGVMTSCAVAWSGAGKGLTVGEWGWRNDGGVLPHLSFTAWDLRGWVKALRAYSGSPAVLLRFPLTMYAVCGTQADRAQNNKVSSTRKKQTHHPRSKYAKPPLLFQSPSRAASSPLLTGPVLRHFVR
jgi:hypothetical protein